MKLQKFENVDVIAPLEAIMKQNTAFIREGFCHRQTDFAESGGKPYPGGQTAFCGFPPSGTCCLERDVFLKGHKAA